AARHGVANSAFQAQVGGGTYRTLNGQAGGNYFDGRTGFSGGLMSNNSDGPEQRGTRGGFNVHTASFGLHHFFSPKTRLAFRSSYDERDFSAQNFYTTSVTDTATERVRTYWNQLSLSWEGDKDRFTVDAGYKNTRDYFRLNNIGTPNENKSGLLQLNLRNEHRFREGLVLTSGVQYGNRAIVSNDRGDHKENQLAAVAALGWTPGKGFTVTPALRLDWHERRGTELVPQLALSYRYGAWQFRGAAGKTIRDADFTERYNNYEKPIVAAGSRIGNPALQAERATATELGADYYIGKAFRVSGSFFRRWHRGLVDYVPTPYAEMPRRDNLVPGGTYALARNIADITITGAELDLHYRQDLRGTGRSLEGSVGFTWAEARNEGDVAGFYLNSFAKYLLNAHLAYTSPRISIGFTGIYKERAAGAEATAIKAELSKDYFVLNGKVNFFILPRRLGVFAQADNIFDRNYSDLLGARMPGRWWTGGIQLKF
ncbi:MAG: TonB-dependent receptor, partial [Chitinophagaceae bacterium]